MWLVVPCLLITKEHCNECKEQVNVCPFARIILYVLTELNLPFFQVFSFFFKSIIFSPSFWRWCISLKFCLSLFRTFSLRFYINSTLAGFLDCIWTLINENFHETHFMFQVKSEDIERSFSEGKATHDFKTESFSYKINFKDMVQENLDQRYRTKRKVRRRPGQVTG